MNSNSAQRLKEWREGMRRWRQTGDFSALTEAAGGMHAAWRRVFLDTILPDSLRRDLDAALRERVA